MSTCLVELLGKAISGWQAIGKVYRLEVCQYRLESFIVRYKLLL